MNWDDFRYFLAVARNGKLTAAGRSLGVDHATVGRRIKQLETQLGTPLFDRSPRGYSLTDKGQEMIGLAEDIESGAIRAQELISGDKQTLKGAVRIGAPEGVASYLLAESAAQLCRLHPGLEIQIIALPQTFSLSKREADIAIAVSPPTSGRLKFRKIADYQLHMYGTQDYLARHPNIHEIDDLITVRGIGYVHDLIYDKELDYIPLVSPKLKPHLTSTSVQVQLEATLADAGVCILHDFMASQYDTLVKVLPEKIAFTRTFWLVVHEDYANLQRIRIVTDTIINHMRRQLTSQSG